MRYFLAHNEIDVFHYGEITEEQVVTTGQPYLEFFDNLDELKERLSFFNIEYKDKENQETQSLEEFIGFEELPIDNDASII